MKRIAGILAAGGGLILIVWVTSPSARTAPSTPPISAAELALAEEAAQSIPPLASQVDDQAARLRARLSQPPQKPQPARNPFKFRGTEPFSTEKAPKGTEPFGAFSVEKGSVPFAPPRAAPAIALPSLVAITSDARDGGLFRMAVLSMNDEMKIVQPGQGFDRFIVEAIGQDFVRMVDITSPTRATFTVAIR